MKIQTYTSQGKLTEKSGAIFNPGVTVPLSIAGAQARGATQIASALKDVANWAEKKQDLIDKAQATKAATVYQQQAQELYQKLLSPRDEQDPVLGVNLFQIDEKQREAMWAAGKKKIRAKVRDKFGPTIGSRSYRAVLDTAIIKSNLTLDRNFSTAINKRVAADALAAALSEIEGRFNDLSDPNLSSGDAGLISKELESKFRLLAANGLQTGNQIQALREKLGFETLSTSIRMASDSYRGEEGVIKGKWIRELEKTPTLALSNHRNAHALWEKATNAEKKQIIEDLQVEHKRQVTIANAEAKRQEDAADDEVATIVRDIFELGISKEKRLRLFRELEKNLEHHPDAIKPQMWLKIQQHAHTGKSTDFPDDPTFNQLMIDMNNFTVADDGSLQAAVTMDIISEASLSGAQRTRLIQELKQSKDRLAVQVKTNIKAAAGLVEDMELALTDEKGRNEAIQTAVADYMSEFSGWYMKNAGATRAKIFEKGAEIEKKVRGQVAILYVDEYERVARAFEKRPDLRPLFDAVGGDVKKLLDEETAKAAIAAVMNADKKFSGVGGKPDSRWRITTLRRLERLRRYHKRSQAGM